MEQKLGELVIVALVLLVFVCIPWWIASGVARRTARRAQQSKIESAAELGHTLMLESGPVSAAQMQLIWHGIHQELAVYEVITTERLRYLITEARRIRP